MYGLEKLANLPIVTDDNPTRSHIDLITFGFFRMSIQ